MRLSGDGMAGEMVRGQTKPKVKNQNLVSVPGCSDGGSC